MQKWLAAVILLTATAAAPACPMCKDSVANKEGGSTDSLRDANNATGQNITGGINASVYLMLGALLGIMGLVSTVLVKGVRSSNAGRGFPVEPRRDDDNANPES